MKLKLVLQFKEKPKEQVIKIRRKYKKQNIKIFCFFTSHNEYYLQNIYLNIDKNIENKEKKNKIYWKN